MRYCCVDVWDALVETTNRSCRHRSTLDLVSNPDQTKVVVATEHVAKDGSPKIVQNCKLPLTGAKCVSTIITDMCVFQVDRDNGELWLTELAEGTDVDDVRAKTDAKFRVADEILPM